MIGKRAFFIINWYNTHLLCIKWRIAAFFLFGLIFLPFYSFSQNEIDYDEILVFFNVQKFGEIEINAVIKNEAAYLPVTDVFNFLKIKNNISKDQDSISGFFLNQKALYLIDKNSNKIEYQGKIFQLKPGDLISTGYNLYLKSNYFGEIFGLDCTFSFRSLTVSLTTKLELPVIREMRQEQLRTNISRLKGEIKSDTIIKRNYPFFSLGMADWSIISTQQLKGKSDARLNFTVGSVIAGGETNISLNYNKNAPFSEKEQYYSWRFVNNDFRALRQVMAGKISSQITSSIFNPIVGIQFSNTPTTYRRSFGTYSLTDITKPNWIVELYVNGVLVDYVKADANGYFKFEVPLVYGNSAVTLRFYGPWGEEKSREVNISIPFNFLPAKELEYSVSAGFVEDSLNSRFSRTIVSYGLTPRITMGGGVEYLSSVINGSTMPFVNTSLRLGNSLLLMGEYTQNVRFKSLLSYRLPSNLQFELNYTHYKKGQKAIIYNYLEERKAVISIPMKSQNFSAYSRLTINQIVMENLKNTNAELLLSGAIYGINTNFTTYGLFSDPSNPFIYSNLSLAFRLPKRIVFTPQIQYEYLLSDLISTKANLEKPLFNRGFLNLSYEQNFKSNISSIEIGLRYDLPFAQTGFSARQSNDMSSLVQSARGSLLFDPKTNYISANNRSSVGKGAITFIPFLDLNCNDHREPDEPKVAGLNLRINGGRILVSQRDTTIRVVDLVPYTSYFVELNKNSFENIAWQIKNQSMSINVDANRFKSIEIPVAVMGEVSGTVYEKTKNNKIGMGRILVNFYRNDSLVARTMSEADGYFSLLGLAPGPYTVRIDTVQLKKIGQLEKSTMTVIPSSSPITVRRSKDGDVIDGLEFTLTSASTQNALKDASKGTNFITSGKADASQVNSGTIKKENFPSSQELGKLNRINKDSVSGTSMKSKLINQSPAPFAVLGKQKLINKDSITGTSLKAFSSPTGPIFAEGSTEIQVGAFAKKTNATFWLKKAEKVSGRKCIIIVEEGLYKIRMQGFKDRIQAGSYLPEIIAKGFGDAFVVVYHQGIIIQVSAFINKMNALSDQKKVTALTGRKFKIIEEKGFYKIRLEGFSGRKEAEAYLPGLIRLGFPDAFIIRDNTTPENN